MKNLIKCLFIVSALLAAVDVFAYDFSVENKTAREIKADVYLESNDPHIATVSHAVVVDPKQTARVTLFIENPKESYTDVSDVIGHGCTLHRYRNMRVIEVNDRFVCLPR